MRNIVVVADMFADEYVGGAELSTEALIECAPKEIEIIKLKAINVNHQKIDEHIDAFWIFTNFTNMPYYLMPKIAQNLSYVIVEYDYKLCWWRSPHLHRLNMGVDCNCAAPIVVEFFKAAKCTFFMSHRQADWYFDKLEPIESCVLGSLFSDRTLAKMESLRSTPKSEKWAIIYAKSPIKGHTHAVQYAKDNNIPYDELKDLAYGELLRTLAGYKGLIYKPIGGDTCPRAVLEAQMMGLELDLNDNVEHKDEHCYQSIEATTNHLSKNKHDFWLNILVERLYGVHK